MIRGVTIGLADSVVSMLVVYLDRSEDHLSTITKSVMVGAQETVS